MANRYPIIVDTTDGNKLKEIPSGDNLQLTGNGIIGVTDVTASGTVAAGVLSATSIKKGGTEIATVAITGSFDDLINRPIALSDLTDDLNVLVPGDSVGQLTNNVGYLTTVAFSELTSTPTTLAGYGITDAATSIQGALASTALQPGANISTLFNNAGYVTAADLADGLITVDVNNTGDLVGNVYADDSTLLVDSVLAAFNLDGTIRSNVVPAADGVYDLGAADAQFKDLHISGNILGGITSNLTQTLVQSFLSNSQSLQLTNASSRIISFAPVGTSATVLLPEEDYEGIIFTFINLASNANSFTVSGALSSFTVAPGEVKSFVFDGSDWALASTSTGGDTVGNFTFASSVIDTDDSSAITVTPAVIMSSDLTIENDLTVNGDIITTATGTPEIFSDDNIFLTAPSGVIVSNDITVEGKIVGDYENGTSTIGSTRIVSYDVEALQDLNTVDSYVNGKIYGGATSNAKNLAIGSTPPTDSTGADGDRAGMIAFDSTSIYYCIANWASPGTANIWVKQDWGTTGAWS